MGRYLLLATADSIYSDENNFLPLVLSTSSTSALPASPYSAAKSNKGQKEEVEAGRRSMVIELSVEPWVSWIWGVSLPTWASL